MATRSSGPTRAISASTATSSALPRSSWCEATRFKSTLNAVQDLEGALESAGARAQRSATTRLELPAGWKVLESPPSASGESPFGKFELNSELKDQVLSMELSSQLLPLRVEDDQTAAYTAFLQQHEKALGQPLVLRKE